jgi:diacylglycerol kinase family enzyme
LLALMRAAGYQVRYQSSKEKHLASALSESADLVVVAGGDGTIATVARLMRGRDTPIALLPIGTANNISTALGIIGLTLAQHVAGWKDGRHISFDIARARGPWGSRCFVEAFGVGLMPHLMNVSTDRRVAPDAERAGAKSARALRSARAALHFLPGFELAATVDGREISGRYVLLEVMNIGLVGPNLNFAAMADPTDGLLDIVAVRDEERELLGDCLQAEQQGERWPHEFPVLRGTRLTIKRLRDATHIDDEVSESRARSRNRSVDLSIDDRVRIVLPEERGDGPPR